MAEGYLRLSIRAGSAGTKIRRIMPPKMIRESTIEPIGPFKSSMFSSLKKTGEIYQRIVT
jgi:hypothetical protein